MKTNIIKFASVAVAAVAVQSCGDESMMKSPMVERTIVAGSEAIGSRTAIDPTEYSDRRVGILWTGGDAIGVYGKAAKNAYFITTQTGGRVPFTGEFPSDDAPLYAYYPYNIENDGLEPDNLKGVLPTVQYRKSEGLIDGDYKYGKLRNNTDDEFDFNHIFSLLCFEVNATGTNLEGEALESVEVSVEGRTLSGDFTFSAIDGSYSFTGTETANSLTLKWDEKPALAEGVTIIGHASCAPTIKAGDKVKVTVTTDKRTASFTAEAVYDFHPETLYTFQLTLSAYQSADYGYEETEAEQPAEPAEEETANCYMITTVGEHDFKATVIGNGAKGIIPGAGFHTEDPNIDPKSAKLLWEDTEGFISDVTLTDGRVHYKANTNVGNAVIAVYSGANCTGTILWSWHIWGVGDTLPEDFDINTKNGSTFAMMDRDLGAFPSTDEQRLQSVRVESDEYQVIHAMLYQWGRKDPFPNTDFYQDGSLVSIATTMYNIDKPTADDATISYAIQHPTNFIDLYTTAKVSDWLSTHNYLLWGDDRFSGNNDGGWTNVKTIYDPSPVGYRVPNYYAYGSFIPGTNVVSEIKGRMDIRTETGIPALCEVINCVIDTFMNGTTIRYLPKGVHENRIGMSADNLKQHCYGIYMKRNDADEDGNFFAQTGTIIGGGSRNEYGISSYRWMSCGATTNTIDPAAFQLYKFAWRNSSSTSKTGTNADHDYGLYGNAAGAVGLIKTQYSLQPRYGCAVRCVREK